MADLIGGKVSPISMVPSDATRAARIVNTSAVIERLPTGILVCGLTPTNVVETLFINEFARNIFESKENVQLPCSFDSLCAANEGYVLVGQIIEVFRTGRDTTFEWSVRTNVTEKFLNTTLIPLKDHEGEVYQVVCAVEDQTAEKLAERNLLHHAFHDPLTGQPNRVLFRNKLEETVGEGQRHKESAGCAVIIINIDRFQQINESFGHSAGDRFLIAMAATLRRCIRGSDTLARLSGDEFAILVAHYHDMSEVEAICERIHSAMEQPYDLDGNEVFISVSVGVATTISSSTHPEDLIRDADFAMHRAKSAGKARTEVYQRDTHQKARAQFHLETELRRAVERHELELYYQPIIDLKSQTLHGFEGLTRWFHKDRGFVSPIDFISLAEETGIIVNLGRWALDAACERVREWIDLYGPDKAVPVNVNVSGIQFARDDMAKTVESALAKHGIAGHLIRIELTESAIMANPLRISESLSRIRRLGVKVALDDFGTGYSSLNYLHQFPIDIIKIDRSFINQLKPGNTIYRILEMVGMLGKSLGHEIVAEGLEDLEHVNMLRGMGFSYGQGYYYAKPVDHTEASKMVKGQLPWTA